ncbi:Hsp20/alpha crystallin family protein [Amycolatopsis sp. K13G38]|uniref:Hsp20/alpha crystallin family protein n=1 Tax=Amycolatopsis acididurans TaxID=2724524 RepID=A0ABX1IX76_9PSEU|nr:Hsp20/alpha crystallin family protein [Amycolatopsis acididurans]NKQ52082.1 Hsp20/alpha crystallin family protein [Amycolatopsis acididurans]
MALPAMRTGGSVRRLDPFRDFDRLFDSLVPRRDEQPQPELFTPRADVSETEQEYVLDIELPGVRRDDITVEADGTDIRVTGELKDKEREGRFHRKARRVGKFAYRVSLPRDVDGGNIAATLDEGVLTVRIPKAEAAKPRRIEITSGE